MAGDKDPYKVARSQVDPTKWAVFTQDGTETQFRYDDRSAANTKCRKMNSRAHGGPQ